MGLTGKMVRDVEIKSDGDVFHEIFRYRPHHISTMSPGNIQNVDLHEGDWGTVGSVIFWNYTHGMKITSLYVTLPYANLPLRPLDIANVKINEQWEDGKEKTAKEVIEAIDEEKKLVTFKVVEGDLLQLYKTFIITVHVDTKGENNLVTWTLEYEKLNGDVEDPITFMDLCIVVTKDIETHHLK
ncbi:hypothetical protein RHGRI_026695 [Rhododendron griersonianum]|uniref:Bet v I/Major latex protein domain-containing protein n=1 Tax=Rhododendron griersonianum TaxID=479676 RepID=A0AAV6IYQ4_9ERIC|nr:hypothetical protein RHGRI_026695 [Rhododendron griersonianum]